MQILFHGSSASKQPVLEQFSVQNWAVDGYNNSTRL